MSEQKMKVFIFRFLCAIGATIGIALLWKNPAYTSIMIFTFAVLINLKSSKAELIFYLFTGIAAALIESIPVTAGAWTYKQESLLNIPLWLPFYWGMGGLVMKDTFHIVTYFVDHKKTT